MPQVVEAKSFDPGFTSCSQESPFHIRHRLFCRWIEENEFSGRIFRSQFQQLPPKPFAQGDEPDPSALRPLNPDLARLEVDLAPSQPQDLAPPHARIEGGQDDGPEVWDASLEKPLFLWL